MAETTVAVPGDAGYCPPHSAWGGVNPITTALQAVGAIQPHSGFTLEVYYFNDVSDTNTYTFNIPNIHAVAWQPDQADADICAVTLTNVATGEVTWDCQNASSQGWLWVLRGK
jgi:hypothetical protein